MGVSKPFRIIMHWTGGNPIVGEDDEDHYHYITGGDGKLVEGRFPPEANNNPRPGEYAAHTRNCNTGAIGMAIDGMFGTTPPEAPSFDPGPNALTQSQLAAYIRHVATVAKRYGIEITRTRCLSHAEVQPTLGITQNGKWDIAWIPGMERPGDPIEVGDELRRRIKAEMLND